MRKRELFLLIGIMTCLTIALAALISLQMEAASRSEQNIQRICNKLQRIDGEPCDLLQPSDRETRLFAFIRRAESAAPGLPRVAARLPSDCPVIVSTRNVYHVDEGRYRAQVARRADNCFPTIAAAQSAGARAPH